MSRLLRYGQLFIVLALGLALAPSLHAQGPSSASAPPAARAQGPSCDFSDVPGAVWWGTDAEMTLGRLAAYLAPVYWFSPDEPLMNGAEGLEIRLPEALPFETAPDAPVVYYQFEEIITVAGFEGGGYTPNPSDKDASLIDLANVGVMRLSYFAYFTDEVGLGAHPHDVEATEYKLGVVRSDGEYIKRYDTKAQCGERNYIIVVTRVSAKAHGLIWYWNVIEIDEYSKFPMHLLVEEGKHGLATDKNSDGYFTPGYDVSQHINDAWGVRDVIAQGRLFSGGFQAWMVKVRRPEHRVFPPLPDDSPLRDDLARLQRSYTEGNAVYELRPFPKAELAADDKGLYHLMEDKEVHDWPHLDEKGDFGDFMSWVDAGAAVKSLSIALYADGDLGFSFVFPFFIVKNLEDPMTGGFIVWRMYLKDEDLRDFGWMLMYTPSASRWIDTYIAAGAEWDAEVVNGESNTDVDFVLETGIKFRVNMAHSPIKFVTLLTDFWGVRIGVKNKGFFDIDRLTYVLEVGAGAF